MNAIANSINNFVQNIALVFGDFGSSTSENAALTNQVKHLEEQLNRYKF